MQKIKNIRRFLSYTLQNLHRIPIDDKEVHEKKKMRDFFIK
jgi:hypothetical protein